MRRGDSEIPAAEWANPKEGKFLRDRPFPWDTVAYEVKMFYATYEIVLSPADLDQLPRVLANAVEESAVLHTRSLCHIFRFKGRPDDIKLSELFSEWDTDKYSRVQGLMGDLSNRYGPDTKGWPRWNFDKLMAHSTVHRDISFDYTPDLRTLRPVLQDIIAEIEFLRRASFATGFRDLNLSKLSV